MAKHYRSTAEANAKRLAESPELRAEYHKSMLEIVGTMAKTETTLRRRIKELRKALKEVAKLHGSLIARDALSADSKLARKR